MDTVMRLSLSLVLILLDVTYIQNLAYAKPSMESPGDIKYAPDLCKSPEIDAVTKTGNGQTYFFKGEYYWRITNDGIVDGYPRVIMNDWKGLPGNLDAALTTPDNKTYFFKDSRLWKFQNMKMDHGYPKEIKVEFKGIPDNIDAALVWSGNGRTYFFKGSQYWRYEEGQDTTIKNSYPRPISNWAGVPNNLNAAFQWENGKSYFFKDRNYYRFNDQIVRVDQARPSFPRPTAVGWFDCKSIPDNDPVVHLPVTVKITETEETGSSVTNQPSTETTIANAITQSDRADVEQESRPTDSKLSWKGSYDMGIWNEYSTTDDSAIVSSGISEDNSASDNSSASDVDIWKEDSTANYSSSNNVSHSSRVTAMNVTVNLPNKSSNTMFLDMILLLNVLPILWY